jgi:hypothetical protein
MLVGVVGKYSVQARLGTLGLVAASARYYYYRKYVCSSRAAVKRTYISKETFQWTLARANAGRLKVSDGQDGPESSLLLSTRRRRLSLGHILKRETCLEGQGSCFMHHKPATLEHQDPDPPSRLTTPRTVSRVLRRGGERSWRGEKREDCS